MNVLDFFVLGSKDCDMFEQQSVRTVTFSAGRRTELAMNGQAP
jgi:hypothetical protein